MTDRDPLDLTPREAEEQATTGGAVVEPAKFITSEDDDDVIEREVCIRLDPLKLRPHGDRYIIQKLRIGDKIRVAVDEAAGGGIKTLYTSSKDDEERDGYYYGRVIAKGTGHRLDDNIIVPMPFEPGDIVMVEKYSGRPYHLYGADKKLHLYLTVNQVDVLTSVPELSPPRSETTRFGLTDEGRMVQVL